MPQYKTILTISLILVLLAEFAAIMGIFSQNGNGETQIKSVRNTTVSVYGRGIYRDMPNDVAPQGIAQDYVTLFIGIPLLLYALIKAQNESIRDRLFLAGVLAYFMLTYLFWMAMCMYNDLFLIYVILAGLSLNAFLLVILHLPPKRVKSAFLDRIPRKSAGWFLILTTIFVGGLWLSIILPSILYGRYPKELYHFTTLIVQAMDLAYFLPFGFVSGVLLLKKSPWGYLFASVYLVLLSLLMAALLAKFVYMRSLGFEVGVPQLAMMSVILLGAVYFSINVFKGIAH
ncbi:MAG TPA: hypothetical protein PL124_06200 [Candidatus Cloacimonadota bacterium]|nr:hypothetical protein [Candidatus Cloacimonadota bacterium]